MDPVCDLNACRAAIASWLSGGSRTAACRLCGAHPHRALLDAAAEVLVGRAFAQQTVSEILGEECFADTAGTGKQVCVRRARAQFVEELGRELAMAVQSL